MCKVGDIIEQLDDLNHSELLQLENVIIERRKQFLPFRIKLIYKQCGKPECTCQMGTKDEGYWHGPYLTARWRENGKTRTASLGREYSQDEIKDIGKVILPKWYDFRISDKTYDNMSRDRQWETSQRSLDNGEFLAHYGLEQSEDSVGRPRKFRYDRLKYKQELEQSERGLKIASSPWGTFGIGTWNGIVILDSLVKRGYYFKE